MKKESSFGSWLYNRRRALDLTRKALASQIGYAEVTLRRIENGTLKPSKELAYILLEKLGIPESERQNWVQFARGLAEYPEQSITTSPAKSLTNLPSALTTFIGREKEQAEIIQHLNKYRLVTLTGSGGIGKTRLSIKVGEQVLNDYPNGVWLTELAPLSDSTLLPQTIAKVFGVAAESDMPLIEILVNFLRRKTTLLILDNCEHLLDAVAQLIDTLLKNCPNLKILATSREPMGITGEAVYHVPSLGLPNIQLLLDNFKDYESVRLFDERAQLAQPDFSLTMDNASFVTRICTRLDGIPLALELAAAKVSMFSTKQIAEQLEESFNLLTGGSRTALPRQQTIRASINWSWGLLTVSEQTFMRQLSVFAGGWTLESAQAVCDGDVLDLTNSLLKKSLIVVKPEAGRAARYRFHEIVHQYACEKLLETGEDSTIRKRHLKYFLDFSALDEPVLHGHQQLEWFNRVNDEQGNIRVALEQAFWTNVEAGLYLSGKLIRYWINFDLREGLDWTTKFIQKPDSRAYPHGRAKALLAQGNILWYLQQFNAARSTAEECLALFRACGDRQGEFEGLMLMGTVMQHLEGMDRKIEIHEQALALAQSIGDIWRQAIALSALGWDQRNPQHSRACWEEAIAIFRQVGDWRNLAFTLSTLGYAVLSSGEIESAQKLLDESLELNQRMHNKNGMEFVLTGKGQVALLRGEYEQAHAFLQEWAVLAEDMGNRMGYLWARARLGYVALREGNVTEANQILVEIIENFHKDRNKSGLAFALDKIASLYSVSDKPVYAAHLIGWVDATRDEIGDPRPLLEQADVDKIIAACLAKTGETTFIDAYARGKKLSLDEAVALALEKAD